MRYSIALIATLLAGCKAFSPTFEDCRAEQEYQRAREVAPLGVPEGLDLPNTRAALRIPDVPMSPPPPDDRCLDSPPRYRTEPAPAG